MSLLTTETLTTVVNSYILIMTRLVNRLKRGAPMNELFENLDKEKRDRIINASLKEFAAKGFDLASTNTIVKEANISKGSLFNYFENKKGLYAAMADYSASIIEEIYKEVDLDEADLFKKIEAIGLAKLKIQQRYPQVFEFLFSMATEDSKEVEHVNQMKINNLYKDGFEKMYEHVDYSLFKEGIDVEKAIDILNWSLLGFGNKAMDKIDSIEEVEASYLKEWEDYSALLKQAFYK